MTAAFNLLRIIHTLHTPREKMGPLAFQEGAARPPLRPSEILQGNLPPGVWEVITW